jgi:nucleoside-diphosphate-sugar epimerase
MVDLKLGDVSPTRDLLFVKDTVDAFTAIAKCEALIGHDVNIASQSEISVRELAEKLIKLTGTNSEIVFDDNRVRPEKSEVFRLFGSREKLNAFTGWQPLFSLDDGLKETISWFSKAENLRQYKADIYNV